MIVIIEGPDGTGKTTLSKELEKNGMVYHYLSRGSNYTTEEMSKMMYDEKVHILDRGFFTPWVYRLTEQRPLDKTDFSFEIMYAYMTCKRLKVIYCTYPYGFQAAKARGEDLVTDSNTWERIKSTYDFIMNTISLYNICPIYRYCWSTDTVDNVMKFIKEDIDAV